MGARVGPNKCVNATFYVIVVSKKYVHCVCISQILLW